MTVTTFYTAQSGQTNTSPAGAGAATGVAGGNGGGLLAGTGFAAFLLQPGNALQQNPAQQITQQTPNSGLFETKINDLAIAQNSIIAQNQLLSELSDGDGILEELLQGLDGILSADAIEAIKNGEALPTTGEIFLPNVNKGDIKNAVNSLFEQIGDTAITLNLTPAELAEQVAELEKDKDALNFALVQLLPPEKTAASPLNHALSVEQIQELSQGQSTAGQLNSLQRRATPDEKFQWGDADNAGAQAEGKGLGHNGLATQQGLNGAAFGETTHAVAKQQALDSQAPNNAQYNALSGWPFESEGSLLQSLGWSDDALDAYGSATPGAPTANGNATAGLANISTFARHAHLPHPGTSMVAATIQKAAANGESKSISLKLDPPELGRVEVKMEFHSDKKVKAVVSAEKPETLAMLQRDANSLEKALQDTGLDLDGNGLSFELSQDQNFSQDGRHDGSRNQASANGQNSDAEDELNIIESTMTWHVDPETGHARYNIWA